MRGFNLTPRNEERNCSEANRVIDTAIYKAFHDSLDEPFETYSLFYVIDSDRIYCTAETENIPYGSSNLGESGSGLFCFHQGLRLRRGIKIPIGWLLAEAVNTGYYDPTDGGTSRLLFDNYNVKRARHIQEVFDSLRNNTRPVITALLNNTACKKHYVNIVGIDRIYQNSFMVDNPIIDHTTFVPFKDIFANIEIAWIW